MPAERNRFRRKQKVCFPAGPCHSKEEFGVVMGPDKIVEGAWVVAFYRVILGSSLRKLTPAELRKKKCITYGY